MNTTPHKIGSEAFLKMAVGVSTLLCCAALAQAEPDYADIRSNSSDTLDLYLGNDLFFSYHYQNAAKPYCYPIYGPDNLLMVRNYPMKKVEGEETDHPHQKAFWFTHGNVNGVDYWAEGPQKGTIQHQNFLRIQSGAQQGCIESLNYWVKPDGKTVQLKDIRKLTFSGDKEKRTLDFSVTLTAIGNDVVFGDTKEGTFGIRLAESMRLKGGLNKGHIANSEGLTDAATWGKRANWVDYSGPVQDKTVGIAILDHPQNPRHPTWWHVRDYGLFAANPFGISDFEKKPRGTGDLLLKKGESITFQYRIIFHKGNEIDSKIAEEYQKYSQ